MNDSTTVSLVVFVLGVACGAVGDRVIQARSASMSPAPAASSTTSAPPPNPSEERVEWCYVKSWRSTLRNPIDPLGPGELHWALHGHHPHDRWSSDEAVVATGDSIDEMVAMAKELGCPLHDVAPSW